MIFSSKIIYLFYWMPLLGVFSQYLELQMSEWHALGIVRNIRGNPMNLICTNVSGLWLFPSQFSNLVDQNDCCKSFYGVFQRYLELLMSERHALEVVGIIRGNPTNLISTIMSGLQLFPTQFSYLVDWNDCRKSFYGVF